MPSTYDFTPLKTLCYYFCSLSRNVFIAEICRDLFPLGVGRSQVYYALDLLAKSEYPGPEVISKTEFMFAANRAQQLIKCCYRRPGYKVSRKLEAAKAILRYLLAEPAPRHQSVLLKALRIEGFGRPIIMGALEYLKGKNKLFVKPYLNTLLYSVNEKVIQDAGIK